MTAQLQRQNQRQLAQLKLAATGGAGGFVLPWLRPRNVGMGEILRCAQNDGATSTAKSKATGPAKAGRYRWCGRLRDALVEASKRWHGEILRCAQNDGAISTAKTKATGPAKAGRYRWLFGVLREWLELRCRWPGYSAALVVKASTTAMFGSKSCGRLWRCCKYSGAL